MESEKNEFMKKEIVEVANDNIKSYKDVSEEEQKAILRNTKRWFRDTCKPTFNFDAVYDEETETVMIVYLGEHKKPNYNI